MELVGQDRFVAIQQEEGDALDDGVVEIAIGGEGDRAEGGPTPFDSARHTLLVDHIGTGSGTPLCQLSAGGSRS